ncbi:LacI family DNA-binding transcriptional regulator [Phytomonospora sp. NPDC050363]|uniref:LacI family DNA-binding transcriptional regulator n=1 Tax=Phytomonospora sp. NPDC050363 TaxID=3155642 RepID=UPI00340A59BA
MADPGTLPSDLDGSTRAAVMADVARLAGVSHTTVSRVINGHPSVRESTRHRVRQAMTALAYRPNSAARTLVTGRSRVLGVICMDPTYYGPVSVLSAVERSARQSGYAVSIANLPGLDRRSLTDAVDFLAAQAVVGIIAITPHAATMAALAHVPAGIPIVAVEGCSGAVPTAAVDQYLGARLATEHLLGLGHRTVVHIAGPADWYEAPERERGWRDALTDIARPTPSVERGDWTAASGYAATRRILARDRLTALFVANDQMALGALLALHQAGLDVPGDVSVVGFDDAPEAAYYTPPLTTVRQDFAEVGRTGMDLLLEQIEGAARSTRRVITIPGLVVRASTARPPNDQGRHTA